MQCASRDEAKELAETARGRGLRPRAPLAATSSSARRRRRTPTRSPRACTARSSRAASSSGRPLPGTRSPSSAAWGAPEPALARLTPPRRRVCFCRRGSSRGLVERAPLESLQHARVLRICKKPFSRRSSAEAADPLAAAAYRAEAWAGEPFLRDGEDPAQRARPGHRAPPRARRGDRRDRGRQAARRARSGRCASRLMLGLERVLAEPEPRTESRHGAAPPPGGRARRDAHRADRRRAAPRRRTATATATRDRRGVEDEDDEDDELVVEGDEDEERAEALTPEQDPGAVRRYRFRHPTASGKTIAAAGFVEAARTLGVLILTHRRLLVSQFTRELTTEGYGDRFTDAIETRQGAAAHEPDHDPDVRVVRAARRRDRAATRTSSSSATRRTRRSARRRPPRSARSRSRSTSA